LRPQIEERAGRGDLQGRVDLLGYRPYPEYLEELSRANFLLAPSVTARDGDSEGGAPVCLLEAQAMGVPVVATTHCDIPEVTRPDESALLAPERDVPELARKLDALLRDSSRWPAMGRAGRAHVEAEFDIRSQVRKMEALYRELL
jgi:colanic acid/amylovoran biosynthesis glycosyltransferase